MSAHTPGPWAVRERGPNDVEYCRVVALYEGCKVFGQTIALAYAASGQPGRESSDANARLIAASPDLLAELKRLHAKTGEQATADLIAAAEAQS